VFLRTRRPRSHRLPNAFAPSGSRFLDLCDRASAIRPAVGRVGKGSATRRGEKRRHAGRGRIRNARGVFGPHYPRMAVGRRTLGFFSSDGTGSRERRAVTVVSASSSRAGGVLRFLLDRVGLAGANVADTP